MLHKTQLKIEHIGHIPAYKRTFLYMAAYQKEPIEQFSSLSFFFLLFLCNKVVRALFFFFKRLCWNIRSMLRFPFFPTAVRKSKKEETESSFFSRIWMNEKSNNWHFSAKKSSFLLRLRNSVPRSNHNFLY